MDPDYTLMTVVDWSPEKGAAWASVEIPEDEKEMVRVLKDARKLALQRRRHMEDLHWSLVHQAHRMLASSRCLSSWPRREAAQVAMSRLSMMLEYSVRRDLKARCWPRIPRTSTVDRHLVLLKMQGIASGHGWMTGMEDILEDVGQLLRHPGRRPLC